MVVLLSGGIDSLVCAELARGDGVLKGCVFVDYGHPAQIAEGWKAFAYCGERGIPLKVVHVFGLDLGDMGSEKGARVVPCRNAVLLAVAANAAVGMGADTLLVGANAADQNEYTDCRRPFLNAMADALGVEVSAPLLHSTKREIISLARGFGLDRSEAWACYGPGPEECGECPSCVHADAGWRDDD